jgi:hypothetical protein
MAKFISKKLEKGEISTARFDDVTLHLYSTGDPMGDVVTLIEKNGHGVVIDPPSFKDNIKALTDFIESENITVDGVVYAYHMAGATFLPKATKYSTEKAEQYAREGAGKAMVAEFTEAFGDKFDGTLPKITRYIVGDEAEIADIKFVIKDTNDAFDLDIPEINATYMHMLGHDVHSIVPSVEIGRSMIDDLKSISKAGYDLVLSSHYSPETISDVKKKIQYLEKLVDIAEESASADEFKSKMNCGFKGYSGDSYLDMTAQMLFN